MMRVFVKAKSLYALIALFVVYQGTGNYILGSPPCDLLSISVCVGSHHFANDNGNYSLGDGTGNTYRCITVGSNFTGNISTSNGAQNVDNYLCIEDGASAPLGGNIRPRINIINYGTFIQNSSWPGSGGSPPLNTFQNYGNFQINVNNAEFLSYWGPFVNHPGGIITSVANGPALVFNGFTLENYGTINIPKAVSLVGGGTINSTGNFTTAGDFVVGWGSPTVNAEGNFTVGGNVTLSSVFNCDGCNLNVTGNFNYTGGSGKLLEVYNESNVQIGGSLFVSSGNPLNIQESMVSVGAGLNSASGANIDIVDSDVSVEGNSSLGSATQIYVDGSNVLFDGNFTMLSSNGLFTILEASVTVIGNANFSWNCGIVFLNCGSFSATGNIYSEGPVTGPGYPAGLIVAGGNIHLHNNAAVTSGYVDFCAGGSFTHVTAPPLGANVTECEYEEEIDGGIVLGRDLGITCDNIVLNAEFLSFDLRWHSQKDELILDWVTNENGENLTYYIKRGQSVMGLEVIDSVKSSGNWLTVKHSYTDRDLPSGTWVYQITSINEFGQVSHSPLRVVNVETNYRDEGFSLNIFPNPARSYLTVRWEDMYGDLDQKNVSIIVVDYLGRLVLEQNAAPQSSSNHIELDLSNLHPGLYILEVNGARTRFVKE